MATGDYAPGFFVDYQLKDLRLAADAARRGHLPLPGLALAETLFQAAARQGYGRESSHALHKVIRSLAGQEGG
jgi:3-hydroxyisobutyrate dehydrogenase